jgi:hypothetical protein
MSTAVYNAIKGEIWSFDRMAYCHRDMGFEFIHALYWMHNALWVANALRKWRIVVCGERGTQVGSVMRLSDNARKFFTG